MKMLHTVGALIASWAEQNEIKNDCTIRDGGRVISDLSLLKTSCAVHILECALIQTELLQRGKLEYSGDL